MSRSLPLLVVPGILEDTASWQAALAPLGRAVIALPNYGETIAAMAASMLERAPPRFMLLGHSLGGYVAQQIALTAAERVAALALVSTSARAETAASRERRAALVNAARTDFPAVVAQLARAALAPDSRAAHLAALSATMLAGGVERFAREQQAAASRPTFAGRLGVIACPALVVTGTLDAVIDPAASPEIAAELPAAQLVRIEGCGHMPQLERPAALLGALHGLEAAQTAS